MNKCPCEECITLAICINKEKIKCSILYNYLGGESYVRNCIALSILKAYFFYILSYRRELKFVRDKKMAKRIIYDRNRTC